MNRPSTLAAFAVSLLLVSLALPTCDAAAQGASRFVGAWKIVSTDTIDASGEKTPTIGANPRGLPQRSHGGRNVQTLLPVIVTWLAANFDLPESHDYPRIEFVPPEKLYAMLFGGQESGQSPGSAAKLGQLARRNGGRDVEALYDKVSRTMYLRKGWTGAKPAEASVLVHELVHHLQNVAGLKYECPQASEELAYAAQDRWLARSGRNLMNEFKLNPMTLLLRTKCIS